MITFKDTKGDDWVLSLNVGLVEDIKEATSVDLDLILTNPEKLAELFLSTPRKLVEILFVICEDQIKERNLDARAFGKRFDRDTLDIAANKMIEAVVNFYPRSSAGRVIGEKLPELLANMEKKVETKAREMMANQKELLNGHTS